VNRAVNDDTRTRTRIQEHWAASERGDSDAEHAPTYSVSIMEFAEGLVTHETQYFADPFPAAASRAALAEPIPGRGR
jgi:hypothetical protein